VAVDRGAELPISMDFDDTSSWDGPLSVEEPSALTVEAGEGEGEEQLVPTVDLIAPFWAQLVKSDGRPRPIVHWLVACNVMQALHFQIGTFATPGLPEAIATGDRLAIAGCAFMASCLLFNAFNTFHGVTLELQQLLGKLRVGERRVSAGRWKEVEKFMRAGTWKFFFVNRAPDVIVATLCVTYGWGAQEDRMMNRISAPIFVFLFAFVNWPLGFGPMGAQHIAVHLVAQQADDLVAVVRGKPRVEEWYSKVVAPTKELVVNLRLLSDVCGNQMITFAPKLLSILGTMQCFGWSDTVHNNIGRAGVPWLATAVAISFTVFFSPFIILMVYSSFKPAAEISTACDTLRFELNQLRFDDLTEVTSRRIALLERMLDRENELKGIGVSLPLIGIMNKRLLNQIASGFVGAVLFVLPIIFQSAVTLTAESAAAVNVRTDERIAAVEAALDALNITCGSG
jgi:hypothetical protein